KGAVVELAQRGDEGLAAEPADPPVHVAVDAARDAVVVLVVRIGVGQDDRVGHEIEQAAPEDHGRGPHGARRRQRRGRVRAEPEGRRGPGAAHRVGSSFSTLSATSLPPARWHTTRTTSPGCTPITPPEAPAAAVPATRTPVGTLIRTRRRACPTPVMSSSVPVFACTEWTVPWEVEGTGGWGAGC